MILFSFVAFVLFSVSAWMALCMPCRTDLCSLLQGLAMVMAVGAGSAWFALSVAALPRAVGCIHYARRHTHAWRAAAIGTAGLCLGMGALATALLSLYRLVLVQ